MTVIWNCMEKTLHIVDGNEQCKINKDLLTDLNQEIDSNLEMLKDRLR